MKHNWNYPTLMWVGKNRINDLVEACQDLKISNPLFVTDKDLINLDMIKQIIPVSYTHLTLPTICSV